MAEIVLETPRALRIWLAKSYYSHQIKQLSIFALGRYDGSAWKQRQSVSRFRRVSESAGSVAVFARPVNAAGGRH